MTIAIGDRLPDVKFNHVGPDGPAQLSTDDIFKGKKVVVFGVPGAFTPTCHANHLPGFLENYEVIKAKGIDDIAVVAVNDMWVMKAWAESTGAKDKILFLSDGNADFAKATGLDADFSAVGFGIRLKRFSMIVEDGMVKTLNVETERGVNVSGASTILDQL